MSPADRAPGEEACGDRGADLVASYDFVLPPERIAQHPRPVRDASRLMVLPRHGGDPRHHTFSDLPGALPDRAVLVLNDTRVIPARLSASRPGGGQAEVLLVRPAAGVEGAFTALVRPSARIRPGTSLRFGDDEAWTAVVEGDAGDGQRVVRLVGPGTVEAFLARCGRVPLPPYITRAAGDDPLDAERYQTVYAREPGAVAAPTAGLHLTETLLDQVRARGVEVVTLTLHVGPGTFAPVRGERLSDHRMHPEPYRVPAATARAITSASGAGRPVVAVGTTTCRAIEAWDEAGRPEDGAERETRLMLHPERPPRVVSGLVTNFHLPRTTLLALVASFAGRERVLAAYREAAGRGYRFYSYGDAMLLV